MLPLSVKGLPSSEIAAAVMNLEASLTRSFFTARSPAGSVAVSVSGVETASVPAFRSSLIRGGLLRFHAGTPAHDSGGEFPFRRVGADLGVQPEIGKTAGIRHRRIILGKRRHGIRDFRFRRREVSPQEQRQNDAVAELLHRVVGRIEGVLAGIADDSGIGVAPAESP